MNAQNTVDTDVGIMKKESLGRDSLHRLSHDSDELMTNICTLAYSRNVNKVVSIDAR